MSTPKRRVVISCSIMLGIMCMCICIATVIGLIVWRAFPEFSFPSVPIGLTSSTSEPHLTEIPRATPTKIVYSSSDEIPAYISTQMDIIQEDVSMLRGLTLTQPIERSLLSPEQLEQRVLDDFLADYSQEEAQNDSVALAAFGLLQSDFDLITFYQRLLTEQIAGFYDDDERKMYVIQEQAFEGIQRMTYAHEYTHALQDDTYDFDKGLGYDDDACEKDSEKCAAIQALIEGDATLAELNWFQEYSTEEDQQQVRDFYGSYKSPVYDSAPEFLKQDFLFPYESGLKFVQALYDSGGWSAVDGAYKNLPLSTEQILHPEKYPSDYPIQVTLPDLSGVLGDNWTEIDQGVMGEWYTYLVLGHGIDPNSRVDLEAASGAADGWGGDRYVIYYDNVSASTTMVIHYSWDSAKDAQEFAAAFQEYATARFGAPVIEESDHLSWQKSDEYHTLYFGEKYSVWILAPDSELAQAIWNTFILP